MLQKVTPNKISKRGGLRHTSPRTKSTSKALAVLFERYGGTSKVGDDLGIHPQAVSRWITHGYVPMRWVGHTARLLGVDNAILNYEGFVRYTGVRASWIATVAETFDSNTAAAILRGDFPLTPKELLA